MMKKIIVLMFVLLMTIQLSYAETTYDSFEYSGESLEDISFISTSTWSIIKVINSVQINDIVEAQGLNYIIYEVPSNYCYNMPLHSDYDTSVTLTVDGDIVGTGIYGYSKSGDESITFLQLHIWEGGLNIGDKTGAKTMMITTNSLPSLSLWMVPGSKWGSRNVKPSSSPEYVYFSCDSGSLTSAAGVSTKLTVSNDYIHSYPFSYTSTEFVNLFEMERDATNTTKGYITANGIELLNETSLKTTDLEVLSYDKTNYTWVVDMYNMYDDVDQKILIFSIPDLPQTSATITNNQTSYTNPEIILSKIVLNEPDYNNYYYRVKVMYEKYSDSYDYAVVSYNQSQIISNDESYYEIDINEDYYDLPIKFKVIVESYNKNSGESVIIGESNIFMYNPSQYYDNIIEGYILDTTTNAYVSNVHVYYNNSLESYYDLTDNNGYFKFYLPTDLYNVHIEKNNYHDTDFSQYIDYSELTKIYITPLDEDINLYGNVLNLNTNLPLSDVKITVNNETYTQFTYSNNYGYYEFYNIQNNTNYTLIAELDNYYSFNELIIIPSDAPKYQLINLIPIIDDIDTDIDQQIEDLKEEIQPIKDLIFGLSEIVIDNPDYNNDNIISENEYASFINSLVSLVLVIFIVIMYIGLKDRREKK